MVALEDDAQDGTHGRAGFLALADNIDRDEHFKGLTPRTSGRSGLHADFPVVGGGNLVDLRQESDHEWRVVVENVQHCADGNWLKERQRVDLERERAGLKADLSHAKKIETLLAEERSARANAQLRASTAEAKLSRLEGELEAQSPNKTGGSVFGRLRGR
jgi:hypothetical protein